MVRRPAVAGSFYPADPEVLRKDLDALTAGRRPPDAPRAIALMVPHAGFIYSGRIAGETYTATRLARRVVLLGPNHTGQGEAIAVVEGDAWRLPFGDVPVDGSLAAAILSGCRTARADTLAHRGEHSLEVQIPFLQYLIGGFQFVPICVGTQRLSELLDLGRAVAEAVAAAADEVLLVLSSDMSHYLPAKVGEIQDRRAIERVLAIDPEGLHRIVVEEGITMCGVAPTVVGLEAARRLGAQEARLVAYGNSGDRNGDYQSVVGYAGVAVT